MERGKGGGVLKFVEGPMGVVYGKVALVKGGRAFLSTCLLWWVMVLIVFFGMISGLGRILSKLFTLGYLSVQSRRKLVFPMFCLPMGGNDKV